MIQTQKWSKTDNDPNPVMIQIDANQRKIQVNFYEKYIYSKLIKIKSGVKKDSCEIIQKKGR